MLRRKEIRSRTIVLVRIALVFALWWERYGLLRFIFVWRIQNWLNGVWRWWIWVGDYSMTRLGHQTPAIHGFHWRCMNSIVLELFTRIIFFCEVVPHSKSTYPPLSSTIHSQNIHSFTQIIFRSSSYTIKRKVRIAIFFSFRKSYKLKFLIFSRYILVQDCLAVPTVRSAV